MSKRKHEEVDPDYILQNIAVEHVEKLKEENDESIENLRKVITEEFDKELKARQNQIELIEKQIAKTQKLTHLLRYVLINSYYNNKDLSYPPDANSTNEQFRIHPAVKKLLGKNTLDTSICQSVRRLKSDLKPPSLPDTPTENKGAPKVAVNATRAKSENRKTGVEKQRTKTKYQIIVGNVSKWTSSYEDDNLTHKWMMYVRGPKDYPDVSHFIEKTVFHLHASYKPNDVVEVTEPPFHLSRRGWGEFAVRVQIHFKYKLNKPVDIIHNLKLDKTYSGRQTLGNESVIDLYLYENQTHLSDRDSKNSPGNGNSESKDTSKNFEHDYCTEKAETEFEVDTAHVDHNYSVSSSSEEHPKKDNEKSNAPLTQPNNPLIYGLDDSYLETNEDASKKEPFFYRKTAVYTMKVSKKKTVKVSEGRFIINVPPKFKNMGEVLPYLFKRLPMISDNAKNASYKKMYPFTAKSKDEYFSWNTAKRSSAEWSRAEVVKKLTTDNQILGHQKWTTEIILLYARLHAYSLENLMSFPATKLRNSPARYVIKNCFETSPELQKSNVVTKNYDALVVDVVNNPDSTKDDGISKHRTIVDLSEPFFQSQCSYVKREALECGVVLKNEEIIEGVMFNGAAKMIHEAVRCLVNHLLRRSIYNSIMKSGKLNQVNEVDVQAAISERKDLEALAHFREKQKNIKFFLK